MIDIQTESLVTLSEVAKLVPGRGGGRLSYPTIFRWASQGARGRILESVRIGGQRYTSREALVRFAESGTPAPTPPAAIRTASRERSIASAEAVLDRAGIGGAR